MAKTGPLFWLFVLVLLGTEGGSSATGGLGHTARPTPPGQGQGGRGGVNGNDLKYPTDNGGFGLQGEHLAIGEGGFGHQKVEQNDPPGGPGAGSDVECRQVKKQHNASAQCQFVKTTDDCDIDEGFINYTEAVYCTFTTKLLPLAIIVLVLWWLFLFIALAVAADDFFCPSLVVMAKTLRMSDNIAGVTLLAFGNGAPDVFSAIAAVGSMKNGDAGLAVGALVGAGIFVTTVVAGSVAMVRPFHAMERPFLRDIVFYLLAVFMTFFVLYSGITLGRAVAFIGIYIVYVIVVIVGRYIYQKRKRQRQQLSQGDEDEVSRHEDGYEQIPDRPTDTPAPASLRNMAASIEDDCEDPTFNTHAAAKPVWPGRGGDTVNADSDELTPLIRSNSDPAPAPSAACEFAAAVCPIDVDGWKDMKWYGKIYAICKMPVDLILRLTIPIVDLSEEKHHWNRHLNCLHCVTSPLIALIWANHHVAFTLLGGVFPVWALVVLIGVVLAAIVYFTSTNSTPPPYHRAFAFLGFLTAVLWIEAIANEIVNLLQTFGILFSISNAILGLTLLAWGNSLGDLVADTTMAKQGFPKTGISACFGGPLFNLLMGIGIPFTIKTVTDGPLQVHLTVIQVLLLATLTVSLLSSLIILPLIGFNLNRYYGLYLYALYVVFLIFAILVETDVIKGTL